MATHPIRIDRSKRLSEEPRTGHNRWHPDIPPVMRVDPGDTVVMETRDALDGAITPGTTVADLQRVDLDLVHPLTGPVFVDGAEPGDLLEVHIVDITPQPFGFTTIIPARETGGNFDIKQLTAGTTLLLPVDVPGALFSTGDSHFAQGDGESCGTAVEMGATLTVRFGVRKGVAAQRGIRRPQFERTVADPRASLPQRFFATTGMPITREDRNESEDVTLAARDALLNMIDHLVAERGYSREQAYALTSVAVNLHISELVDVPNVTVSAFLPLDIFV